MLILAVICYIWGCSFLFQDARGVCLTIPMPGHPVGPTEVTGVREECRQLAELVEGHDIVFLGTDTRDSRWLPTLLCSATNTVRRGEGVGRAYFD